MQLKANLLKIAQISSVNLTRDSSGRSNTLRLACVVAIKSFESCNISKHQLITKQCNKLQSNAWSFM